LNLIHHLCLLSYKSITELFRPLEVAIHHPDYVRKDHQRLDAGVPRQVLKGCGQWLSVKRYIIGMLEPTGGFRHLERIRRRHQNLRHKRVRIKGDGCKHPL
jgi:hypothetical protein